MITYRYSATEADLGHVGRITRSSGYFNAEEIAIAVELTEIAWQRGSAGGYEVVLMDRDGETIGYSIYGRTPATVKSWDLYWIAVDERARGEGLGRRLLRHTESRIAAHGPGQRVYAETAGRPQYASTRAFYERSGYTLAARLEDFYAPGDDKLTYLLVLE